MWCPPLCFLVTTCFLLNSQQEVFLKTPGEITFWSTGNAHLEKAVPIRDECSAQNLPIFWQPFYDRPCLPRQLFCGFPTAFSQNSKNAHKFQPQINKSKQRAPCRKQFSMFDLQSETEFQGETAISDFNLISLYSLIKYIFPFFPVAAFYAFFPQCQSVLNGSSLKTQFCYAKINTALLVLSDFKNIKSNLSFNWTEFV